MRPLTLVGGWHSPAAAAPAALMAIAARLSPPPPLPSSNTASSYMYPPWSTMVKQPLTAPPCNHAVNPPPHTHTYPQSLFEHTSSRPSLTLVGGWSSPAAAAAAALSMTIAARLSSPPHPPSPLPACPTPRCLRPQTPGSTLVKLPAPPPLNYTPPHTHTTPNSPPPHTHLGWWVVLPRCCRSRRTQHGHCCQAVTAARGAMVHAATRVSWALDPVGAWRRGGGGRW
jgi:hypothetical protein